MYRLLKPIKLALILVVFVGFSGCTLGQTKASPTATPVDIKAVMTSAAATAFVQLTQIAGQASPTNAPSQTPTKTPPTKTPDILPVTATQLSALQLLTPTPVDAAGGLPKTETPQAGGGLPGSTAAPSLTPFSTPIVPLATTSGSVITCYNSAFVADVTIPDGTVLQPYEKFHKIWRVQNTGTCAWDQGFGLTIWAGPDMNGSPIYFSDNDQPVQPGGIVDLGIEMRAPTQAGDYIAHWVMINDQGYTFGSSLTVYIKVAK